jgi:MFS family permease
MTQEMREIFTRDFVHNFFAMFTFTFVFTSLIPTLPIYLSRLGSNEVEIGVLIGSFALSSLTLRPFIGKALLKIPEKYFMMAGAFLFFLASVGYLFTPPFWPFLIVRVLQGIGFSFFQTASFTLVANISSAGRRGQSLSYFTLAMSFSSAVGPAIGMFVINHFNFTFLFLVCCGLSLGSLLISNQLGKRPVASSQHPSIKNGSFLSRKAIPPSALSFSPLFVWGAVGAFFPLYAISQGVANPGYFFTALAIMVIFGRALGGRFLDLYHWDKIILPCLFSSIISMIILAFSGNLPMFLLVAIVWGSGNAFLIPVLATYALDRADSPGTAMGTFTAFSDLGVCLGPVIMGIVLHHTGYPIMFLCLAFIGVLNLVYFYYFVRKKG